MSVFYAPIANGQTVSSAFTLDRPGERAIVSVPSHAANGWRLEWSNSLTGPFAPGARLDGSGLTFDGFSGTNGAFFETRILGPIARVRLASDASAVTTPTIAPSPYW